MKSIFALALAMLPALSMGAALPVEVEETSIEARAAQIVGGTAAAAGEIPYQVAILRSGSLYCGGSLLNAYTVITAAHCSQASASVFTVRAGSLNYGSGGTTSAVRQILYHPSYSSSTTNNDIAVWRLSTPINAGGNIGYVTLPASGNDPASGATSVVSGWGATSESGSISSTLRKVSVPVVARATCNSQYGGGVTTAMFCAGVTSGGKDSCQGDSGGPITVGGSLAGVVSWGNGCARAGYPGVYTRVGSFVTWINANKWTS